MNQDERRLKRGYSKLQCKAKSVLKKAPQGADRSSICGKRSWYMGVKEDAFQDLICFVLRDAFFEASLIYVEAAGGKMQQCGSSSH